MGFHTHSPVGDEPQLEVSVCVVGGALRLEINFNFLQSWEFDPFIPTAHTHTYYINPQTHFLSPLSFAFFSFMNKAEKRKEFPFLDY